MTAPGRNAGGEEHGDVFGRGWGNMFIHVQRESGLAHRTLILRPWQIQALRLVVSRWFAVIVGVAVLSWAYFALQTARVPLLTNRITHLEQDAEKIDTLQAMLEQLQRRYAQVQQMLSASARNAPEAKNPGPAAAHSTASKPPAGSTTPLDSIRSAVPVKALPSSPSTAPKPAASTSSAAPKAAIQRSEKPPAKTPPTKPDSTTELSWHS